MKISPNFIELLKKGSCTLVITLLLSTPVIAEGEASTNEVRSTTKIESRESYNSSIPISSNASLFIDENGESHLIYTNLDEANKTDVIVSNGEEETSVTLDTNNLEETISVLEKTLESIDCPQDISDYPSFILVTHWEKTGNYKKGGDYTNGNREYKRTAYYFRANENYNKEYFENGLEKIAKFFRDDKNSSEVFDVIETKEQVITVSPEEEKNLNTEKDIITIEGTNMVIKIQSREEEKSERTISIISKIPLFVLYTIFAISAIKKWHRFG